MVHAKEKPYRVTHSTTLNSIDKIDHRVSLVNTWRLRCYDVTHEIHLRIKVILVIFITSVFVRETIDKLSSLAVHT